MTVLPSDAPTAPSTRDIVESAVVRFAGDSGDGIQLLGARFAAATAIAGNDLATFPDFPAEIRAPAGTTYGVSAFQINFGARVIKTAGDAADVLIALNPAALKVELGRVKRGGIILIDTGSVSERALRKAGYASDPLNDGTLDGFRVVPIDISRLTLESVKTLGLSKHDALRCKNMWALGLVYWMYGRALSATEAWLRRRFAGKETLADANIAALRAGHAFGETAEINSEVPSYTVGRAPLAPGVYRSITGGEAMAWGLMTGAHLARLKAVFASYPITPASPILHILSSVKNDIVTTLQAEDEIAAVCAAIGASYTGAIGITSSSGPGLSLKAEALGLAVAVELPLVVINTQRAGPSTGMPTKTEQADLLQALFGRHGESPLAVIAARSPADCFAVAIEAVRLAARHMTPVIVLSDGYIANASQPWRIPAVSDLERFPVTFHTDPNGFHPFLRDPHTLARPWAIPGTPGLQHRIGGLEKDYDSGNISYDPANHDRMTRVRAEKIARIADDIPDQDVDQGPRSGTLAVVGWGSTYGPISRAVALALARGEDVAHIHVRYLNPLPKNLGQLLGGFRRVLLPEMNAGQLRFLLRAQYALDIEGLSKVAGQPFKIEEIENAIRERL